MPALAPVTTATGSPLGGITRDHALPFDDSGGGRSDQEPNQFLTRMSLFAFGSQACRVGQVRTLNVGRNHPYDLDARSAHQFADRLQAKFGVAVSDRFADRRRGAWLSGHELCLRRNLLGDPQFPPD